MYQRGSRFSPPAIAWVYGSDRSVRIVPARRWICRIRSAGSSTPTGRLNRIRVSRLPPIGSVSPRMLTGMVTWRSPTSAPCFAW